MLETQTSHICKQFLNNIGMKDPRTDYNEIKVLPDVQRFILKHIQNFDKVFCNLERVKFTVAEVKSQ